MKTLNFNRTLVVTGAYPGISYLGLVDAVEGVQQAKLPQNEAGEPVLF
jgi:hypothetical protein